MKIKTFNEIFSRQILRDAFLQAKQEIIIVSPFITENAIRSDDLPKLIEKSKMKAVQITIYTDPQLNLSNGVPKQSFVKGKFFWKKAVQSSKKFAPNTAKH